MKFRTFSLLVAETSEVDTNLNLCFDDIEKWVLFLDETFLVERLLLLVFNGFLISIKIFGCFHIIC